MLEGEGLTSNTHAGTTSSSLECLGAIQDTWSLVVPDSKQ